MGSSFEWSQQPPEIHGINGDRRQDRRYDLRLNMRWKLIRRRRVLDTGAGQTVDLSSGGLCFETERPLPLGLNVELSISWPVMLHDVAALQLVVYGKIVRSNGKRTGIIMNQHEFRTAGNTTAARSPLPFLGGMTRNAI